MQVASSQDSEVRITLEVLIGIVNGLDPRGHEPRPAPIDADAIRSLLRDHGFSRAGAAPAAAVRRLVDRLGEFGPLVHDLPDLSVERAAARVSEELTELTIVPSIADHDGVGPHLHWSPPTATFDDQVVADMLMAIAHELVDRGVRRFGRCGAVDCDRLFFDGSRNGSRRFCDDPRCASRTHTADHRRRNRTRSG